MDVSKFLERAETAMRKRLPDQAIAMYRQVLVASPPGQQFIVSSRQASVKTSTLQAGAGRAFVYYRPGS